MKKLIDKNFFWLFWLGSLCIVSCVFSFYALKALYIHFSLDNQTMTKEISWIKKENWLGRWRIIADYSYEVDSKTFHQKSSLQGSQFLNEKCAEKAIEEKRQRQEKIWYSRESPNISSLEKKFPYNLVVRATISVLIFLYFLGMKLFVKYED